MEVKILYMYYVSIYKNIVHLGYGRTTMCNNDSISHIPKYYTLIRCILYLLATIYIDTRVLFTYTQKTRLIWCDGLIAILSH